MNQLNKYIKPFLHTLCWSILIVIPLYLMMRNSYMDHNPYIGFFIRISILIVLFYINYLSLIDKLLFNKRFISYFAINLVLVVILISLQSYLFGLMMHQDPPESKHEGGPPIGLFMFWDYLLVMLTIGMSIAIKTTIQWNQDTINYEKIKNIQLEAESQNLRNQLNPHFLFNTLNNIYSLIAFDQDKAQESVHRLSGLLRYILYDNNELFVPIHKELAFTQNYIDLMTLRLASNVQLTIAINSHGSQDQIASLMFITLIENAFKHGISNKANCFIDINISVEPAKQVLCVVENSLADELSVKENKDSGIGLLNLQKRLELLYPNRYEFVSEKRTDRFYCLLKIDLQIMNYEL